MLKKTYYLLIALLCTPTTNSMLRHFKLNERNELIHCENKKPNKKRNNKKTASQNAQKVLKIITRLPSNFEDFFASWNKEENNNLVNDHNSHQNTPGTTHPKTISHPLNNDGSPIGSIHLIPIKNLNELQNYCYLCSYCKILFPNSTQFEQHFQACINTANK